MGSGKTTIARALARALAWDYVPASLPAVFYLDDLFSNRRRWAFETQAAFLIYKAIGIQDMLRVEHSILLDRSLSEDILIFAQYFYEQGDIDERSYETYQALARHLVESLRPPDLAIMCECPIDVLQQRIKSRGRAYQSRYPMGHLERLAELYANWKANFSDCALYELNTSEADTRDPLVSDAIAHELAAILNSLEGSPGQLGLFETNLSARVSGGNDLLRLVKAGLSPNRTEGHLVRILSPSSRKMAFPAAYIAAPFTGHASPLPPDPELLFDLRSPYGRLKPSAFRRMLLGVDRELRVLGVLGFLPHRDINRWGDRRLKPEQVAALCSEYVREADIFVGIPGLSHGSHYEFGLALGLGKPAIVIHCEEILESFIAGGFSENRVGLLTLRCKTMRQVPGLLRSAEVRRFLNDYIPISWEAADDAEIS